MLALFAPVGSELWMSIPKGIHLCYPFSKSMIKGL